MSNIQKPRLPSRLTHNQSWIKHLPRNVPVWLKEKNQRRAWLLVVKQKEPTDWMDSMVAAVKVPKIRICIETRDLKKAIRREHFPMTTVENVFAGMPQAKAFSVLDTTSGYWQVKSDEASPTFCTFNTSFGRYRFTRLPFGIKSALEECQNRMSELFADVEGKQEESFQTLEQMASSTPILC